MPYGLYLSAAGAQAQSQRLEVLTNNLANADTPGFKRELAVLQARHSEARERGEDHLGSRLLNELGGGVSMPETLTDFGPGALKQTKIATDMALEGQEGFFLVEKEGQQLLTRAGNFRFSDDGRLLTQQGHAVLSEEGGPVQIDPALPWRLLEHGAIEQAGDLQALALVQPSSPGDLVKVGENAFSALGPLQPLAAPERRVLGGYLEQSTVRPMLEMMQLMEASRAYESNVKMIQHQDQMLGSLVSRVLRAS